jgi:hypothetical protein
VLRERKTTTSDEEDAYKIQMTYERTQATWDEVQKASDTMLGCRSCTLCDSAVAAGDERSDESSTKVMPSKKRPHDPHDQEHSL